MKISSWFFFYFLFLCFYCFPRKYVVVWVIVTYYEVLISFVFKVQHYYTTNPGLILLVCEQNHNTYERLLMLCIFYVMNFPWLGHIIQTRNKRGFIFQRSKNLWAWEWKYTNETSQERFDYLMLHLSDSMLQNVQKSTNSMFYLCKNKSWIMQDTYLL